MHVERVVRAIALLRQIHAEGRPFDLRDWFSQQDAIFDCGTAACAVGWMVRDKWMQDEGLDVDVNRGEPVYLTYKDHKPIWLYGFDAVGAFFEIPYQSQPVFSLSYYCGPVTANAVADHMQGWLDAEPGDWQKNRLDAEAPSQIESLGEETSGHVVRDLQPV